MAVSRPLSNRTHFSLSAGYVRMLHQNSALTISVPGIGTLSATSDDKAGWLEYDASLSHRISPRTSIGIFASGVAGRRRDVASEAHASISLRVRF